MRLNKQNTYDRQKFLNQGIHHEDLYFNDGSVPSNDIIQRFLDLVESKFQATNMLSGGDGGSGLGNHQGAGGAIAVHCKAGLGRTGTLIGLWCMKHVKMPVGLGFSCFV